MKVSAEKFIKNENVYLCFGHTDVFIVLSRMSSLHIKVLLSYFCFYVENVVSYRKLFVSLSLFYGQFVLVCFNLRGIKNLFHDHGEKTSDPKCLNTL